MKPDRFPTYVKHADARCFNCNTSLAKEEHVDFGQKNFVGRYMARCPKCKMGTWYDIGQQQRRAI